MDIQKRLGEEKIHKLLLEFSVPAIVGMIVNTLYNVIDRNVYRSYKRYW